MANGHRSGRHGCPLEGKGRTGHPCEEQGAGKTSFSIVQELKKKKQSRTDSDSDGWVDFPISRKDMFQSKRDSETQQTAQEPEVTSQLLRLLTREQETGSPKGADREAILVP